MKMKNSTKKTLFIDRVQGTKFLDIHKTFLKNVYELVKKYSFKSKFDHFSIVLNVTLEKCTNFCIKISRFESYNKVD